MKKWFILLFLSILYISCSSKENENEKEKDIKWVLEREQLNGAILVSDGNEVYFADAYGYANKEHNIKNTITTKFPIASITKQFTAACIMLLQEDGLLNVNDPITKYIDYPTEEVMTIHHLLSMTSGISDAYLFDLFLQEIGENDYEIGKNDDRDLELWTLFSTSFIKSEIFYSPEEIFNSIPKKDSESIKAGVEYEYCNANYNILGLIIEKVSGLSYGDFLNKRIFKPLGMDNTGTEGYFSNVKNTAIGYTDLSLHEIAPQYNMSSTYASGSIYSTVEDLYKWSLALNSSFFSESSKNEMFSQYSQTDSYLDYNNIYYGYGWLVSKEYEEIIHRGGTWGYRSQIYLNLLKNHVIIILSNTNDNEPLGEINYHLRTILNNKQ